MTTVNDDTVTDRESDVADAGASRPLRKDAARNRQLLIESARVVFAERGLDASLDDIARHAGVGVGTAYRHFANKRELAKAIFTEGVDEIIALAEDASNDPDPWTGLVRFLEGAAAAQAGDRGLREVIMGVKDDADTERINDALTQHLTRIVDRAKQSGQLREDAATSDIGVCVMMICTVADVFGDYSANLWRRYLPMLLNGLRPGIELSEPPLSEDDTREAFSNVHKHGPRC